MNKYISIIFIVLSMCTIKGFAQKYKTVNNKEQQVIDDFCSTLFDSTSFIVISPLISTSVTCLTTKHLSELEKNNGFDINQFECSPSDTVSIKQIPELYGNGYSTKNGFRLFKDTMLIKTSHYFQVLPIEAVAKKSNPQILEYVKRTYKKEYPRICSFGKVLFSKNKEYAILDFKIYCGSWCGEGGVLLMKYLNNKWVVTFRLMRIII